MSILFDTSYLCGLLDEENVNHKQAANDFLLWGNAEILIPAIVMAELLIADIPGEQVIASCRSLCGSFLPVTDREVSMICTFPPVVRRTLKANDCLVLAHAICHGADLITYDKKLQKVHRKLVAFHAR